MTAASNDTSQSQRFAEFFSALTPRSVPARVFDQARACLSDTLGVGLFGAMIVIRPGFESVSFAHLLVLDRITETSG